MQYKRVKLAGQSYFFTVNLENRSTQLLTDNIQLLPNAVRDVKRKHRFTIDAMVVLPQHLHCIWTMPQNDHDYSMRWGLIKSDLFPNKSLLIVPEQLGGKGILSADWACGVDDLDCGY